MAIDEGSVTPLIMLVLFAVFDAIDHPILIEACIADMCTQMARNMLKLNKDNTELIVFTSNKHLNKTENVRIKVISS